MLDKSKLKITCDLSRAAGLASGVALAAELVKENLNREGLLNVLTEIRELIDKSLEEISREK